MQTRQKFFIAGGLVVLGLGLLSFVLILASALGGSPSGTVGQTPGGSATTTATHHATATPIVPLHPDPNAGWVKAPAVADAKGMAFSRSAPLTGYACVNASHPTTSGGAQTPVSIVVTHNGGRTWSAPILTPVVSLGCAVYISSFDPQDLLLRRVDCGICDYPLQQPYRSRDGGKTWTKLIVPTGGSAGSVFRQFFYAGTTLFATVDPQQGASQEATRDPIIAVSVGGQPFTWANPQNFFAQLPANAADAIFEAFSYQTTFTVEMPTSGPDDPNATFVRTTDNGQTWTAFHDAALARVNLNNIMLLADGKTLLGTDDAAFAQDLEYLSSDGGTTWTRQTLPSLPNVGQGVISFFPQPDGSFYAQVFQFTSPIQYSIYRWAPGAAQWTTISQGGQLALAFVSTTPAGHPNALWKGDTSNSHNFYLPDGFYYHAP